MLDDDTRNNQITTALLLAAGSGFRLRPLTDDQPKCLTEIDGIPILERLVDCLRQQGFKRLVVVVGYLEHRIRQFLGEWQDGLSIEYVVNPRLSYHQQSLLTLVSTRGGPRAFSVD